MNARQQYENFNGGSNLVTTVFRQKRPGRGTVADMEVFFARDDPGGRSIFYRAPSHVLQLQMFGAILPNRALCNHGRLVPGDCQGWKVHERTPSPAGSPAAGQKRFQSLID